MKKYILLFTAGSALTLASCGGNSETKTEDLNQRIDSAVNAKVDDMADEMKAQNDSIINAMAKAKADSVAAAEAAAKKGNTSRTTAKPKAPVLRSPAGNTTQTGGVIAPSTSKPVEVISDKQKQQREQFEKDRNNTNQISEEKKKSQKDRFEKDKQQ